jgi:hypothetical protein
MSDLAEQYQEALDKASECEMLGSLTVDRKKRESYRSQAQFYYRMAEVLRDKLASLPRAKNWRQAKTIVTAEPDADVRSPKRH